jgi:hypothetical protein
MLADWRSKRFPYQGYFGRQKTLFECSPFHTTANGQDNGLGQNTAVLRYATRFILKKRAQKNASFSGMGVYVLAHLHLVFAVDFVFDVGAGVDAGSGVGGVVAAGSAVDGVGEARTDGHELVVADSGIAVDGVVAA